MRLGVIKSDIIFAFQLCRCEKVY
ncbi:MAG: hypothetical protein SWX82_24010 [Cyanobacteriota bacterium]|nr:hypothetical protein [Cyanobacteriota bacterium]